MFCDDCRWEWCDICELYDTFIECEACAGEDEDPLPAKIS